MISTRCSNVTENNERFNGIERAARIAELAAELSRDELVQTAVDAVGHAYATAQDFEARIDALEAENGRLRAELHAVQHAPAARVGRWSDLPRRLVIALSAALRFTLRLFDPARLKRVLKR
jgi:hypothetical protein